MKKAKLISLALALLLSGCASLPRRSGMPTDLAEGNLKGPVKSITETTADLLDYRHPELGGIYDMKAEIHYNPQGYMTLLETRNGPGQKNVTRDEYEYDRTGRIITNSVNFKMSDRTYKRFYYKYDRKGRIIEEGEQSGSYAIYYKYDRRGQVTERRTVYNPGGEKPEVSMTFYKYSKGRLAYVDEGSRSRTYRYDDGGNLAEINYEDGQRDVFDSRGNLIETSQPVTLETEDSTEAYEIDTSIKAEYEYDPHGNWIKRTNYYEGKAISTTTREIEYYR